MGKELAGTDSWARRSQSQQPLPTTEPESAQRSPRTKASVGVVRSKHSKKSLVFAASASPKVYVERLPEKLKKWSHEHPLTRGPEKLSHLTHVLPVDSEFESRSHHEVGVAASAKSTTSKLMKAAVKSASTIQSTELKGTFSLQQFSASVESFTSSLVNKLTAQDFDIRRRTNRDDQAYEKLREAYTQIQSFFSHSSEHGGVDLNPVRDEFSVVWTGIQASHYSGMKLIESDRDLSAHLASTMGKSSLLIKLAQDDPRIAAKLGEKLEKTWENVFIGEEQERANQTRIETLRQEIFDLNRNINHAARVEGQDTLQELRYVKDNLEKERDSAKSEMNKFRSRLNVLFAKRRELFETRTLLDEKNAMVMEELTAQEEATVRETARMARLSAEMEETRSKMGNKTAEMKALDGSLKSVAAKLIETERAVIDQHMINETALREEEFSNNAVDKLKNEVDHQQNQVDRLTMEAYRRTHELRLRQEEIVKLRTELHRADRQRTLNFRKVSSLQSALDTLELERESLRSKIAVLERDLEAAQKWLEENKKRVEELDKQRAFVNRNLRRAVAVTSEHANQVETHEIACRNLEQSVRIYGSEIGEQKSTIRRLERERDFYSHEATKLAQHAAFKLNDIKKMDLSILQYRKNLGELENQLKKTQHVYDMTVYDKSVFERNLRDTLTEIMENVGKIRRMKNHIAAIKVQLNEKNEIIHREALRYDRVLKATEWFSTQARRIQQMAQDVQRQGEALEAERSVLSYSMTEIKGELWKEMYYVNTVASRGEVYQRQLMDKEGTLRSVYDKWRVLHSTIRINASHYRDAVRAVRQLRLEILVLRKRQAAKHKSAGNYVRLRHEAAVLEDCIAKESCMMKALGKQMLHPLNIHRWRVLEATDPEAYELVLRINLLTKRLVDQTFVLHAQQDQLKEKQEMYVEIRRVVEQSPGLETPEDVVYYQGLLVSKKRQLATLQRELVAAESQTDYYREKVRLLNDRMIELKNKYFRSLQLQTSSKLKSSHHRKAKSREPPALTYTVGSVE